MSSAQFPSVAGISFKQMASPRVDAQHAVQETPRRVAAGDVAGNEGDEPYKVVICLQLSYETLGLAACTIRQKTHNENHVSGELSYLIRDFSPCSVDILDTRTTSSLSVFVC